MLSLFLRAQKDIISVSLCLVWQRPLAVLGKKVTQLLCNSHLQISTEAFVKIWLNKIGIF